MNTLTIEGSTITRNIATGTGGGGIFLWNDTPYNVPMTVNIRNTISYLNNSVADSNFKKMGSMTLSVTHSCISPLLAGVGNTIADPLIENGGWHLKSGSPCIDAGSNAFASGTDLEGESRIINLVVDIGADEFSDSDGDGLPDWWEEQNGFDRFDESDVSGDSDGDGVLDLVEFVRGTDPKDPLSLNTVLYADSDNGDDANDGLSPVNESNGHGPKRTVQSALTAAISGDAVYLTGSVAFNETELSVNGKDITLLTDGNITFE